MKVDFITEKNFREYVLDKLFPNQEWVCNKTFEGGGLFRPDFRCEKLKLIVEFDGYQHYTQSKVISRDEKKKALFESLGYRVVNFPYWLQPDENVLSILFKGFSCDFKQQFSNSHQGFMSDAFTDVLPADFCERGIARFEKELSMLDKTTLMRVYWSLDKKIAKYGIENVLYPSAYMGNKLPEWAKVINSISHEDLETIGGSII